MNTSSPILTDDIPSEDLKPLQSPTALQLAQVAGEVAHELNNPLAIIMGRLGQLQRLVEQGRDDSEAVQKVMDSLLKGCHRLTTVAQTLQNFANNISKGNLSQVNAQLILENLRLRVEGSLNELGMKLRIEVLSDFTVVCYPIQLLTLLEQSVFLLANSAKEEDSVRQIRMLVDESGNLAQFRLLFPETLLGTMQSLIDLSLPLNPQQSDKRFSFVLASAVLKQLNGCALIRDSQGEKGVRQRQRMQELVFQIPQAVVGSS